MRRIINNFVRAAYNNIVEEITITQNGFDGLYMSYLYGKVKERFDFLPSICRLNRRQEYAEIEFKTEKEYCPYVRRFAETAIADVIAIGYKYRYFENAIRVPLLSPMERRLFFTALVSADYKEDKAYIEKRIRGFENYCLEGLYHFRLQELKKRWEGIVEYIPVETGQDSLDGFFEFLVEDGDGKVFVKDGRVYGEDYRALTRSVLTGVSSTLGEILLSGAERVYCFGETEKTTRTFLEKYYGEKVVFC